MANIWDFNCCGEFKATMKIIQAIFDRGELEKAAKQGKIIRRSLVCSLNKTRFWVFRTLLCSCNKIHVLHLKVTYVHILYQFITAYVDQILISTGAAQITAVPHWPELTFSFTVQTTAASHLL